jgi:N-acyl amino acid synthase of PEP-CTERM/exosortase system
MFKLQNRHEVRYPDSEEISNLTLSFFPLPHNMKAHRVLISCARLRHDVFCINNNWEPTTPDGLEVDQYDSSSHHVALTAKFHGESRQTETVLAYLRLVDGTKSSLESEHPIVPMLATQAQIPSDIREKIAQGKSLEISRLCVSLKFNNRMTNTGGNTNIKPSNLNLIMAWRLCNRLLPDVESFVAILEPALCKQMERQGLKIARIGEPINYKGQRVPVEIDMFENAALVEAMGEHFSSLLAGTIGVQTYENTATSPVHHIRL